jgi:hypothetical protein
MLRMSFQWLAQKACCGSRVALLLKCLAVPLLLAVQ